MQVCEKYYQILAFSFAQLTNPFCSKLSFLPFDFESFVIAHVQIFIFCHFQHLRSSSCYLNGMLCVYKGNDKKKFTNLNLKRNPTWSRKRIGASFQLTIKHTVVTFFDLKTPVYPMMLKCNVCIAQCLLVGYYKSSDQSNKVDQFSTTERCVGSL